MQTFSKTMAPVFTDEEIDDLALELTQAEIEAVSGGSGREREHIGSALCDAWSHMGYSYSGTDSEDDDDHDEDHDHHGGCH